jgi:GT2 family glycosyltransferase
MDCCVIVVDSESTDGTFNILKNMISPRLLIKQRKCSRGEGRNFGVTIAASEIILFTDGDAKPSRNWVKNMVKALTENDLVVGKTTQNGPRRYAKFQRVKLFLNEFEITAPSMNMGIKKEAFMKVKGFDPRLITAEDIDLNLKVVKYGFKVKVCEDCVVTHDSRKELIPFLRQAYWNGYGRSQLKYKNRKNWNKIKKGETNFNEIGLIWLLRNIAAVSGYITFLLRGKKKFNNYPPLEDH